MVVYWILFSILFLPLYICFPVKVVNKQNRIKKGRVIYAPNHQSAFDAFFMITATVRHQRFIAKKEAFKFFLARWVLNGINAIKVDRDKPSRKFLKEVTDALNKEQAVTLFPEGTRREADSEEGLELKNGIAMFALKTNSPIVPVAIMPKPKMFKKMTVVYGKPFYLPKVERIDKETLTQSAEIVAQKMKEVAVDYKESLEKIRIEKENKKLLKKENKENKKLLKTQKKEKQISKK